MKILITGATGFVGRNLCKALNMNHEIYVLTREQSDTSVISPVHQYIFKGDTDDLTSYFLERKIDGVVHLATKYVPEHSGDQIADMVQANIFLGTAVLDATVKAGVKWFLNIGTIWQNYNSPDFSDEYHPVNLYAAMKQAFMTIARFYIETSPIRFCTLKLCDTYGENDSRKKIMDLFAEIAKSGKVLDMSPGEQLLDIVHVNKVVETIEDLINILSDPNKDYREEYVVTSGQHISLKDLAALYEQEHKVKLNINWGGRAYRKREVMKPYIGYSNLSIPEQFR